MNGKPAKQPKPKIELIFEVSPELMDKLGDLLEGGSNLFTSSYRIAAQIKHVQQVKRNRQVVETTNAIVLGARAAQQIGGLLVKLLEGKNHAIHPPDQPD